MVLARQRGGERSDLRRFAIVALALPTAIVAIDHLTWMNAGLLPTYEVKRQFFFPWMIAKTALLTWTAGRAFGSTFYGWLLLAWGVALIDVNIYGASNDRFSSSDVIGLAYTIVSAQAGFLVVWSILSRVAVGWRIAAAMIAAAAIIYHASSLFTSWRAESLPPVQTASAVVLAAVSFALRWKGYRLYQAAPAGDESQPPQREILQFGVKHMLIWTTALAPLVLVIQGIDWIVFRRYKIMDLFPGVLICALTAMVCLATMWLTLGKGNVAGRALVFVLSVVGSGAAMYVLSERLRPIYGIWPEPILINTTVALSRLWGVWFALVGGLLAAMLLFLRAADYRLARRRRP